MIAKEKNTQLRSDLVCWKATEDFDKNKNVFVFKNRSNI